MIPENPACTAETTTPDTSDDLDARRAWHEETIPQWIEAHGGLAALDRDRRNLRVYIRLVRRQAHNRYRAARAAGREWMVRRTPERRSRVSPGSQRPSGRRSTGSSSCGGGDPGGGDLPAPPSWRDAARTFLAATASTILARLTAGGVR